jgi:midasin (ATPase involved in ribosome maturation)
MNIHKLALYTKLLLGISLTEFEYVFLANVDLHGTARAIDSVNRQMEGKEMRVLQEFKIDHDNKQVLVSLNQSNKVLKDAAIAATNNGYELIKILDNPTCACHDCIQFGFTSHPTQVR